MMVSKQRQKKNEELYKIIVSYYKQGYSLRETAFQFGCSPEWVRKLNMKYGAVDKKI
jgi:DNA invertase Pin-like site-specific DNA recombinase